MAFDNIGIGPKNFQVVSAPSLFRNAAAALVNDTFDADRVVADDQLRLVLGGLGIGLR